MVNFRQIKSTSLFILEARCQKQGHRLHIWRLVQHGSLPNVRKEHVKNVPSLHQANKKYGFQRN